RPSLFRTGRAVGGAKLFATAVPRTERAGGWERKLEIGRFPAVVFRRVAYRQRGAASRLTRLLTGRSVASVREAAPSMEMPCYGLGVPDAAMVATAVS